ncbi:MAG: Gldg family protein [Sphingobium sp.]
MSGRFRSATLAILPALGFVLIFAALFGGFLPLSMPLGVAAGGVLETGLLDLSRWWLVAAVAIVIQGAITWRLPARARGWWLVVLTTGIIVAVSLFCWRASLGQPRHEAGRPAGDERAPLTIGIATALPLFWPEGQSPETLLRGGRDGHRGALAGQLGAQPIDFLDTATLTRFDRVVLAQPRLLHPEELVALDEWLARGGKAVIFADPLLAWPNELPLGDPRRPPLTSLLDPLMSHWGVRLEPVGQKEEAMPRRMLSTGHLLLVSSASRFTLEGKAGEGRSCVLRERGLMAVCRVGAGTARLVADADMLDERLWLADSRWPDRASAYASDIMPLLRAWIVDPTQDAGSAAPRRIVNDDALLAAVRWSILVSLGWVLLGWIGQRRFTDGKADRCVSRDAKC